MKLNDITFYLTAIKIEIREFDRLIGIGNRWKKTVRTKKRKQIEKAVECFEKAKKILESFEAKKDQQ
jgi:hypothetical protein